MAELETSRRVSTIVSGGLAGWAYWLLIYPMDALKNRHMTTSLDPKRRMSLLALARKTVRKEGAGALYRGIGVCLVRSFPSNAIYFSVYEYVANLLGGGAK